MSKVKHIIWSNDINLEDWKDYLEEEFPDADEAEQYNAVSELNDSYLDDERVNLNIELGRTILAIGVVATWTGVHGGYKEVGTNIKDCLSDDMCDVCTWFIDERGDLCFVGSHHDSRFTGSPNRYTYRVLSAGLTETQEENFYNRLQTGKYDRRFINRYTERLGDAIANVYGFRIRKKPTRQS